MMTNDSDLTFEWIPVVANIEFIKDALGVKMQPRETQKVDIDPDTI